MKPSIGRIVHYVLAPGEHRPAIIVQVFAQSGYLRNECNMQVVLDGANDERHMPSSMASSGTLGIQAWRASVPQDEETKAVGTWHWPERET